MDIWHVEAKSWTHLILWQVDKQSFKVVAEGNYRPILTNPFYILIDKKYTAVLQALTDQVSFRSVKILDHVSKTEDDAYIQLEIRNKIDPVSIITQNSEGARIWEYDGQVFVSSFLKEEFIKVCQDDFAFSLGFSMFGQR